MLRINSEWGLATRNASLVLRGHPDLQGRMRSWGLETEFNQMVDDSISPVCVRKAH